METVDTSIPVHRAAGIEWSVGSRALPGQSVSGDLHVVVPTAEGVLLAVIDGLGHGDEATQASRRAAAVLTTHAGASPVALVQQCHLALRDTRGAAMTVVCLDRRSRTAAALGIGNVETMVVHATPHVRPARESVLLRNGVVGYQLPPLQAGEFSVVRGDLLVFATDGVHVDFGDKLDAAEPLPRLVARLMAQKFRGTDDALVLAVRITDDEA